jgi:hypothetical protein
MGPSGISDLCGTVAVMVTPKGSKPIGRETLQFFLCVLGAVAYLQVSLLGGSCDETWHVQGIRERNVSWNLPKQSQLWRCNGGFRPRTTQNHLRIKQFVSGTWNSSREAATLLEFHVPLTNCFVRRWFCVVRGPKPPLHRHSWLSFGKFQDTFCSLIPCTHHVSSRLPPSGETYKYATAPSTQRKTWRDSVPIDMLSFSVTILATVPQRSKIQEGLMNYPVISLGD